MDSSLEQNYVAEPSRGEVDSTANREATSAAGKASWGATDVQGHHRGAANPTENAPAIVRQREGYLPFDPESWKLGHNLIDQNEYGRAAECFRQMLLLAETSVDRLSAQAAEIAVQLCDELSRKQSVEEKLRRACRVLGSDLSRLSHEEVSFASGTLADCVKERSATDHYASSDLAVHEPPGATVGGASLPTRETSRVAADRSWLSVHFFGRFEILQDGEVVCLGRNARALAILKYLLAHRGERPVPQDYLMGWLWPESDPKRARWSLNSAVYALRKLLGGCLTFLPPSETVLFEAGGYRLSPHVLMSADTEEFKACYEEGLRMEGDDRVPEAVVKYEKAAKLYRGDYLIEDLYEDWTMIERERLVEAYADLSRRLAVRYIEAGRVHEGMQACYRVLEKDRSDEYAHRVLMECFVRLGQRGRALRQYGLCEQALRSAYDTPPSLEIQALYRSILKDGVPR